MNRDDGKRGTARCPRCGERLAHAGDACPHCGHVERARHLASRWKERQERFAGRRRWVIRGAVLAAILASLAALRGARLFPYKLTRVHAADVVTWNERGEPLRIRCPECNGRGVWRISSGRGLRLFPCATCGGQGSVPARHFYGVIVVPQREATIYDQMAGHRRY